MRSRLESCEKWEFCAQNLSTPVWGASELPFLLGCSFSILVQSRNLMT